MVNGEVCVGLFAIRDIKKVMISAESGEPFIWPKSSCIIKECARDMLIFVIFCMPG